MKSFEKYLEEKNEATMKYQAIYKDSLGNVSTIHCDGSKVWGTSRQTSVGSSLANFAFALTRKDIPSPGGHTAQVKFVKEVVKEAYTKAKKEEGFGNQNKKFAALLSKSLKIPFKGNLS